MQLSRRAFMGGAVLLPFLARDAQAAVSFDVVVYGGTPSGIVAAVAAAREGARVGLVLAGPLGGVASNGLGWTDTGDTRVLGGLCVDVFKRNGRHYGRTKEYKFEPHVIDRIFREMLDEADVTLIPDGVVVRVGKDGSTVRAIALDTDLIIWGKAFVDASYEGDLMALAPCSHRIGRENRAEFGETKAGFNAVPKLVRMKTTDRNGRTYRNFKRWPATHQFGADYRVQSYIYRLCLTTDPANRVPFPKPAGYDADRFAFEIARINSQSVFRAGALLNNKFDLNGDYLGASWWWPRGNWATRKAIMADHYSYQAGLLYTYANDRRLPQSFRDQVNSYGLPADEFVDNNHWPRQLYVREARRLRGLYVMRQQDCLTDTTKPHPIGLGSYDLDSHPTCIFLVDENLVNYEGTMGSGDSIECAPYQIPYECLLPQYYRNLFVSVCVSATHVATSSLRMEPQYMIMGEAAGCAAGIVARTGQSAKSLASGITAKLADRGARVRMPASST